MRACTSSATPASTGPRSGERGVTLWDSPAGQPWLMLQRGRAPESAEWNGAPVEHASTSTLQRGRAPESAEWTRFRCR